MVKVTNHPWEWFKDKVLAPLFVALTISFCAAAFTLYQGVQELTARDTIRARDIDTLKAEMKQYATKTEMLETMKRVELQLELMMTQAQLQRNKKDK